MSENKILQFISKDCKNDAHLKCHSSWTGLGFNIICCCICHVLKSATYIINNNVCMELSNGNNREKKAPEQQVARPACSNTSSQNQPTQQHRVLLDD